MILRVDNAPSFQVNAAYGQAKSAETMKSEPPETKRSTSARSPGESGQAQMQNQEPFAIDNVVAPTNEVAPYEQAAFESVSADLAEKAEDLREFMEKLREMTSLLDHRLQFELDPETNISVIVVTNRETGEVIRKIPPQKVIQTMDKVLDTLGVVLDETA